MTSTSAYRDWIAEMLESQSSWRARKAEEWPDDSRNARSSAALSAAAKFVRDMDPEHPAVRQFAELGKVLDAEGLNGDPETITATYAAGRFFFGREPAQPSSAHFERLLDDMFAETLESWAASEMNSGEELPPLVVAYVEAHGFTVTRWNDEDDDEDV